ncbi:MAG TPA: hypothetical protein PLZ84_06985 [Clostridia bacterium]|nr:hypothetical protein [Clostridia bacterium]
MPKSEKDILKEAEKALKDAKDYYEKLKKELVSIKPDIAAKIESSAQEYAHKLRELHNKKVQTENENTDALKRLEKAYQTLKRNALIDSIDKGVQRSSIIKNTLADIAKEEESEKKGRTAKAMQALTELDSQIEELTRKNNEQIMALKAQAEKYEKEQALNQAKADMEEKQRELNVLEEKQKEEPPNPQKAAEAPKKPPGLPDKYWDRVKAAYAHFKQMNKGELKAYIENNARRLRYELGDQGLWWLERQFGVIPDTYYFKR